MTLAFKTKVFFDTKIVQVKQKCNSLFETNRFIL